jgi:hypothetical protein
VNFVICDFVTVIVNTVNSGIIVLKATHSVLQHFWSDQHRLERSKAMNDPPKNVQMTLEDQSIANRFKVSFLCIPEVM